MLLETSFVIKETYEHRVYSGEMIYSVCADENLVEWYKEELGS